MRKAGLIQVFRYESFVKTYRYMRYFRYHCHPSLLSKTVCRIFDSKVQFWMGLLVKFINAITSCVWDVSFRLQKVLSHVFFKDLIVVSWFKKAIASCVWSVNFSVYRRHASFFSKGSLLSVDSRKSVLLIRDTEKCILNLVISAEFLAFVLCLIVITGVFGLRDQ